MTPREAVQRLCDAGYSTYAIARELEEQGVDCNQSTIQRIKTGEIPDTKYSIGCALVDLAKKHRAAA